MLLIYFKYREFQTDVEHRAYSFAKLAVKPICDGYETYFYSGYYEFPGIADIISCFIEPEITEMSDCRCKWKYSF